MAADVLVCGWGCVRRGVGFRHVRGEDRRVRQGRWCEDGGWNGRWVMWLAGIVVVVVLTLL